MPALTHFIVDNSGFMNIYCILIIIRCSIQINICCGNQSNCSHLRVLRVFKEKRKRGEIKPKLIVGERIKTIPGFVTCFFTIKRHSNGKKNRDIKRSIQVGCEFLPTGYLIFMIFTTHNRKNHGFLLYTGLNLHSFFFFSFCIFILFLSVLFSAHFYLNALTRRTSHNHFRSWDT